TASLLTAAAAYFKASRQCFDSASLPAAGVTPGSGGSGGVTLIPGCSLLDPRPWVQAVSPCPVHGGFLPPFPDLRSGPSLFIWDGPHPFSVARGDTTSLDTRTV